MANQWAIQDQNQFPALIGHSGTAGTAETRRVVIDTSGAITTSSAQLGSVIHTNTHTGSQELRTYQENHICTGNSSTAVLGSAGVFTGQWQDCLDYQEVNVSIVSDQNSATNGLVFQWSADGTAVGDTDVYSYYTASGGTNYTPNPAFRYFRIIFTNGSVQQTTFSLQTILRRSMTGGSFHRIDSTLKDDQDARLNITVPKLKTAANTYVSQTATTAGNAKVSIEEFETAVSDNNKSELKVSLYDAGGDGISIEDRKQTPTGKALNVQIGPGDIISNIPVFMDFGQHQVHEGESFLAQYVDTALDTNVVKFQLIVGNYTNYIQAPHLKISVDIYNGAARFDLYEGGTDISGGSAMTRYNRARSIAIPASTMTINQGVTATGTTLLESGFVGSGSRGSADGSNRDEWILKANTTYILYLTGLATGTDAILHFEWYEDLGV